MTTQSTRWTPPPQEQTCCFTGHRVMEKDPQILPRLEAEIRALAAKGVTHFCAGGARGFDMLAARTVLRLQLELPALELILILPYPGQADRWPSIDQAAYEAIKKHAVHVEYVSDAYDATCLHRRNQRLVDLSAHCICYLRHARSGTGYTVRYAKKQGVSMILI